MINISNLSIKETREYLKQGVKDSLGKEFDQKVWTLAWSKYKRLCDLYNDVAEYSREMEGSFEGNCLALLLSMYNESKDKDKNTYNRDHRKEIRWGK
jgi:hypothetical protein